MKYSLYQIGLFIAILWQLYIMFPNETIVMLYNIAPVPVISFYVMNSLILTTLIIAIIKTKHTVKKTIRFKWG